jgi:HD-like signal output (HDOD) protein
MTETSKQAIQLQINRLKSLPALPEASVRILDAINDPDIAIEKLADVLAMSPGLVARLLGLANSAYFGQSGNISDLSVAIYQVLGLELVKSLSLGIVLNVQFDTGKCRTFNTEYFWMRSLLTALAAQKLAVGNKLPQFSPATIYTSGLLLSIGVLVLGYLIPEELNVILQRSEKNHTGAGDEIQLQLEESHYHLGYVLLQKWQLSPVYQAVLNHFDDAEFSGEEKPLINLLRLSHRLSSMLLNDDGVDMGELERLCEKLSLSTTGLSGTVDELIENRESIQKLAAIMGNR